MIHWLGSPDNFNTSYTERLHIDYAKEAYDATNHKDEFAQMTKWLEHKEKIIHHSQFVQWRVAGKPPLPKYVSLHLPLPPHMKIAKRPLGKVSFDLLERNYHAPYIRDALARYLVQHNNPQATTAQVERLASDFVFHTQRLPVFHKFKLWLGNPNEHRLMSDEFDIIHAYPARKPKEKSKPVVSARFDTVLVHLHTGIGPYQGVKDYRVGQIKIIFTLPPRLILLLHQDQIMGSI
ncbi:hypothetical protein QCA50_016674 [Cerrena zonata]|uniref:Uncharacterized protein n=1 Tax=Cerrena zonata TaxID=2478898 RepID=A0AAW0FM98_9APHY